MLSCPTSPATTTLPLLTDQPGEKIVVLRDTTQNVGRILYDHAVLSVSVRSIGYILLRAADIVITGSLWLLALFSLRRLVIRIGGSKAFERASILSLHILGWSLIALNFWAIVRSAVQPVLLADIAVEHGTARLLPSVARGVPNVENLRIDLTLDPMLLICGLIVLVLAEAFRAGQAIREENESFL